VDRSDELDGEVLSWILHCVECLLLLCCAYHESGNPRKAWARALALALSYTIESGLDRAFAGVALPKILTRIMNTYILYNSRFCLAS
jgi:hypothetical protein